MTPLKIGAALLAAEIADHRDWLFDDARDIELQDFDSHDALMVERAERIAAAKAALDGHEGRVGIHGPFRGLDLDNEDAEVAPLVTRRLILGVEAAAAIGARQMVVHSPFDAWHENNVFNGTDYAAKRTARIAAILGPVLELCAREEVTLVVENIEDPNPATRRILCETIAHPRLRLSIDTGHAQLARRAAGAPPVADVVRDAGALLSHVHLQDVDGHADRHWPPGDGEIEWRAVFAALADAPDPHLVLELRHAADIPRGFAWLRDRGLAV